MKRLLFVLVLLPFGCGGEKTTSDEAQSSDSTSAATAQSADTVAIPTTESRSIDFPIDSLLGFNSEQGLMEAFGKDVRHSRGYLPEGIGEYPNTLLFPDSPDKVEFVWEDSTNMTGLQYIEVSGTETAWKTIEGITLGTTLKDLERLNKKPFTFYGLGWDYAGVVNWQGGQLEKRNVYVTLEYQGESVPPEFDGLIGDHEIKSDSALAQRATLVVNTITLRK